MRTRFLVIIAGALLLSGLLAGCKKQGGDKKAEGEDDGMKSRGMKAMAAMDGEDGMDGMDGMAVADGMEAMQPDRPAEDPPRADAPAADKEAVAEGVLTEVKGTVEVRRAGKEEFEAIAKDAQVFAKDALRVGKDGEATLALWDNSTVELPAETAITVNASDAIKDPAPSITVMAGAARFDVNPRTEGQGPVAIYTPSSVVNVQGTTLVIGVGLSGASRVAVEVGKVDLVPVAKADAPAVEIPQGKVVVVPMGQMSAAAVAYEPAKAGWDEWLEAEDKKGADQAGNLAATHAGQVDGLAKDGETLDEAGAKAEADGEKLSTEAVDAEKKNDAKVYVVVQPKLASNLDMLAAVRNQRQLVDARMAAHAYLLGLMHARIRAGMYKVPGPALERVAREHERAMRLAQARRAHALQRYLAERKSITRHQRAYYQHHPRGRVMAPKLKIVVPPFYANVKLRPVVRPAPIRVVGYNRPIYRQPVYRGKFQPYRPVAVVVKPGAKPVTVPSFRTRTWHQQDQWRKVREARIARQASQRAVWRKAVIEKRQARWVKRPDSRPFLGGRHPGPMGAGPDGMGPHGPGPMVHDPDDMGPRGRGPMMRDPHDMGPHGMPAGMPVLDEIRRRRMERRTMGPGGGQ